MKYLLSFSIQERIKFFLITFIGLFLLEWFIFDQFTPPQSYSLDYLVGLGYLIFIGLLIMNSYRFLYTVYGKTLSFFRTFPINGCQLLFSHFIFSCLEYVFYFSPLCYFIIRAIWNASKLESSSFIVQNSYDLIMNAFWKIGLLFSLFLLIFYFFILIIRLFLSAKNKWIYGSLFLLSGGAIFLLYIKNSWFFNLFVSSELSSPISIAALSEISALFCFLTILFFVLVNIFLMRKLFSPYHDRG